MIRTIASLASGATCVLGAVTGDLISIVAGAAGILLVVLSRRPSARNGEWRSR